MYVLMCIKVNSHRLVIFDIIVSPNTLSIISIEDFARNILILHRNPCCKIGVVISNTVFSNLKTGGKGGASLRKHRGDMEFLLYYLVATYSN